MQETQTLGGELACSLNFRKWTATAGSWLFHRRLVQPSEQTHIRNSKLRGRCHAWLGQSWPSKVIVIIVGIVVEEEKPLEVK